VDAPVTTKSDFSDDSHSQSATELRQNTRTQGERVGWTEDLADFDRASRMFSNSAYGYDTANP
jgi:hypothetical protein